LSVAPLQAPKNKRQGKEFLRLGESYFLTRTPALYVRTFSRAMAPAE
jgi:hypothetical protein